MKEYRLQVLLKIRERTKESAEQNLQLAIRAHEDEKEKCMRIENRLRDTIVARTERQHNFFHSALKKPSSKTEVNCHVLSHQKGMIDEIALRRLLSAQEEQVHSASREVEMALNAVIDAQRNLKAMEKHRAAWQRALLRAEELKEEYATDDQNGMRYWLKKV